MIRPAKALGAVYLCREPVDFRKGMQSLAMLVEASLERDPFAEALYVFTNRRRDAVKLLWWERNGFCLWHKRLERDRFKWPRHLDGVLIELDGEQLNWLLDGLDLRAMQPHKPLNYKTIL